MAKKMKWKFFHIITALLVSIALLNWATVDLFSFNIVEKITFGISWLATIIYLYVGVIGLIWVISILTMLWRRR